MVVNTAEVVISVDVDGTLVRHAHTEDISNEYWQPTISVKNPYDNVTYNYIVHHEHVDLLRQYRGRGFYIKVWTANGVKHAESIVRALGLDDGTVNEVMTKPMKHLDDRTDVESIVGSRVFIPKEGF